MRTLIGLDKEERAMGLVIILTEQSGVRKPMSLIWKIKDRGMMLIDLIKQEEQAMGARYNPREAGKPMSDDPQDHM